MSDFKFIKLNANKKPFYKNHELLLEIDNFYPENFNRLKMYNKRKIINKSSLVYLEYTIIVLAIIFFMCLMFALFKRHSLLK